MPEAINVTQPLIRKYKSDRPKENHQVTLYIQQMISKQRDTGLFKLAQCCSY